MELTTPYCRTVALPAIFIPLLLVLDALAESPLPRIPYKQYSANKTCFIEFTPGSSGKEAKGVARNAATGEVLWEVPWYAHMVTVTNDGVYLIREGSILVRDCHNSKMAVAFCKQGRELQSYTVEDLIKDQPNINPGESPYLWRDSYHPDISPDQRLFPIVLRNGSIYLFEVASGRIVDNPELTRRLARARDLYKQGNKLSVSGQTREADAAWKESQRLWPRWRRPKTRFYPD